MFRSFGWPEALIILTVVVIVFGVGKLPQVGGALGRGISEFRRGKAGLLEDALEEEQEEGEGGEKEKPRRKKGIVGRLTSG